MTGAAMPLALPFRLPEAETVWWIAAAGLLAAFLVLLPLMALDPKLIDGASRWAKPAKFASSTALHFATLALVVHVLSAEWQTSRALLILALLSVGAAVAEVGYIALQAGRMQASHFNVSTPFHAAMYSLMAAGAVMIVAASAGVGIIAAVDSGARLAPALRLGIALGLVLGTILTLITAFRLGANMSHHVGSEAAGAARMPITGWSLSVGDLRPAHFLATHMMQAVPAFGLVAVRLLPGVAAACAVLAFALLWTALTWLTFQDALAGRPLGAFLAR
jgi:hypothetical protein